MGSHIVTPSYVLRSSNKKQRGESCDGTRIEAVQFRQHFSVAKVAYELSGLQVSVLATGDSRIFV